MNVLFLHNKYKQAGGEDLVLNEEYKLLCKYGHQCKISVLSNNTVIGLVNKIVTALNTVWSISGYKFAKHSITGFQPDIVHVHNFFPQLTPAIYDACIDAGVPVVQTLHNYRAVCPGALLMRNGKICEKCITGSPYWAVWHHCYRHSIPGSWAVARMVSYHRKRLTWYEKVDRFIALTKFARQKFLQGGFPGNKVVVKPNFYSEKERAGQEFVGRQGALFVGRLSTEKGVVTLLEAWRGLKISLRIAGDGPLFSKYQKEHNKHISFLGQLTANEVANEMNRASFLVMTSECYEGFPMVLVEAFAHSLPVVATRLGGMAEIVEDGVTGLHFIPGNPQDLAEKVQWLHNHPEECRNMGANARANYVKKYTPERNYKILMNIYQQAIIEQQRRCK